MAGFFTTALAEIKDIKIAFIPFTFDSQSTRVCSDLQLELISQKFHSYLSRSNNLNVKLTTFDENSIHRLVPEWNLSSSAPIDEELLDRLLETLNRENFEFLITGHIKLGGPLKDIIAIESQIIHCQTGKIDFIMNAHKHCNSKYVEFLARELKNQFEMNYSKKIRIGILNFKMTYCDSSELRPTLEETIPTILGTGLSISDAITLVEMKEVGQLLKLINADETETKKGIYNSYTALEIGNLINVNYLIMGEYFYLKKELRIDSRCVNVETGEIILSEGVNIEKFEVSALAEKIRELAESIRKNIEKDLLNKNQTLTKEEQKNLPKILSIVCTPPYPADRANKMRASQIRKTISSKLGLTENLRVKDDIKQINKYLDRDEDRLKISSSLKVNHLLTINFENYNDRNYILRADAYDVTNPTNTYFRSAQNGKTYKIDGMVNEIVFSYLDTLNLLTNELRQSIEEIKVPTYLDRFSAGVRLGNIKRNDQQVFLNDGIGEYGEAFLNFYYKNNVKLELNVGYDTGKSIRTDQNSKAWVRNLQSSIAIKYDINKAKIINPYIGAGLAVFQIARANRTEADNLEEAGDIKGGFILLAGAEIQFQNYPIFISFEPRYILGMKTKEDVTPSGIVFKRGWLGGFFFLGGIGMNLNF